MIPDATQRIAPDAVRRPSRKTALMLPQPLVWARRGLLATGLGCVVALAAVLSPGGSSNVKGWVAGGFFVVAGLASSLGLARRLPLQNVGAAFLVLWTTAFVGITLGVKSGVFFGSLAYAPDFGPRLLGIVPWQLPFLFLALALSSRETARLILRPWRRERNYGFWLLGLGALLMVGSDLALEPFALQVTRWWNWRSPVGPVNLHGVPGILFVGTLVLAVVMLLFVGPWLIAKRPVPTPLDHHALVLWLLLTLFFVTGDAIGGLWASVAAGLALAAVVVGLAWRARSVVAESPSSDGSPGPQPTPLGVRGDR